MSEYVIISPETYAVAFFAIQNKLSGISGDKKRINLTLANVKR